MTRIERAKAILAAADLLTHGHSIFSAAATTGLSRPTVRVVAYECGIPIRRGPKPKAVREPDARALEMIAARQRGDSLEEIGARFNLTRERVRQITAKFGCSGQLSRVYTGPKAKDLRRAESDAKWIAKYGFAWAETKQLIALGATAAYREQKNSSRMRGIEWSLSFQDWWRIWQESGHWNERGRSADGYCMARRGATGPFSKDNVYITTLRQSGVEYQKAIGHTKKHRARGVAGVYHSYPNLTRGWIAKHGQKHLGYFASEAEARTARENFLACHR